MPTARPASWRRGSVVMLLMNLTVEFTELIGSWCRWTASCSRCRIRCRGDAHGGETVERPAGRRRVLQQRALGGARCAATPARGRWRGCSPPGRRSTAVGEGARGDVDGDLRRTGAEADAGGVFRSSTTPAWAAAACSAQASILPEQTRLLGHRDHAVAGSAGPRGRHPSASVGPHRRAVRRRIGRGPSAARVDRLPQRSGAPRGAGGVVFEPRSKNASGRARHSSAPR